MKKILFLSDFSFNIPGGAQKSMEIIMDGLSNEFEFYIIMPGEKFDYQGAYNIIFLKEFDNLLVNNNLVKTFKILMNLYKIIKELKPDVIHTHMVSTMSAVETLKMLGLLKGIKLIYTERGVATQYSKINQVILKRIARDFSKIITTTSINRSIYLNKYLASAEKVRVIPNTAGPLFEKYDHKKHKEMKAYYSVDKPVIMLNGRFAYDKNWEMAKEIIRYITTCYDYEFVIVLGSNKSEQHIAECEKFIKDLQIIAGENKVKGFIDLTLEELSDLYYIADFFILTSRRESFGRTAVEAMARNSIVFGTDIDGLAEVIEFKEYKYKHLDDFKAKFKDLHSKDVEKEKVRFYNRYVQYFSGKKNIDLHRDLYNTLLFEVSETRKNSIKGLGS